MDQSKLYKRKVRAIVSRAIKSGKLIKPDNCSICGCKSQKIEAHHSDYDDPLNVVWVCHDCHRNVIHGKGGHYRRKLDDRQIEEIRQSDKSSYALAKEFGVSSATIVSVREHRGAYE